MSRADHRTSREHEVEYFSDFLINMDRNPITGLLARVTNEESIKQAVKNIVRTDLTERFYAPLTGSKAATSLFDLAGPQLVLLIKQTVTASIKNYEKRVVLLNIDVVQEDYTIIVNISFECVNLPGKVFFTSVLLKKLR